MSEDVTANGPVNRLAREKSPYLLQHAHNPVDWYPWSDEAFERARREDKPIFLSIGYSTCHWCHVMERESFENEEIARLLNRDFISIKVDREERPDVDRVYMTAVQALTGAGGWPLSAFLTPELEPFWAGTYFPPTSRWGRPGFVDVLSQVSRAWRDRRDEVAASARQITEALREISAPSSAGGGADLDRLREQAAQQLHRLHDTDLGGFGSAPKFPRPTLMVFLLREARRCRRPELAEPALHTLREMWKGGIHDHLGGGYHRYSVDAHWRVPHFEKMLYDQAQMVWAFLDAWDQTRDPFFAAASRDVLDYVLRDLRHPDGALYSAEDADSAPDPARPKEKLEGAFYLWRTDEVRDLLPSDQAGAVILRYGLLEEGNTLHDPQQEFGTGNVLYTARSTAEVGDELGVEHDEVERLLDRATATLFEQREQRPRPHLDDKVLTSWNGLAISALARTGAALSERRWVEAAQGAAAFLLEHNRPDGTLVRRWRDGEAAHPAQLDDHSFLALGLLDLYEATLAGRWLRAALELCEEAFERYGAEEPGLIHDSAGDDPTVLVRSRSLTDGAEPAGGSVLAEVALRLGWMLGRPELRARGEALLRRSAADLVRDPTAAPLLLAAAELVDAPPIQVVLRGPRDDPRAEALLAAAHAGPMRRRSVLLWLDDDAQSLLGSERPALPEDEVSSPTAYVCRDFTCDLPTADATRLAEALADAD